MRIGSIYWLTVIVGEEYGEILESLTLRKVIRRSPKETKLHLVFTRHLRESYFIF